MGDVQRTVEQGVNTLTGGSGPKLGGDVGNLFGGSAGYLFPGTVGSRLSNDYYGSQTKQDDAEKQAKQAERLANQSRMHMEDVQNYQTQIANHFAENKAKYTGLLQDANTRPLRADMSRKLADNKINSSSRGLLGSGIEQRNAADTINQYKTKFASGMDRGAQDYENIYSEALQAPLDTGFGLGQLEGSAQNNAFNTALERIRNRNQTDAGVGSAIGTVGGRYLGSRNT